MNFEIPEGLTDMLQDFTVEVLRSRPKDLVHFAAQYFSTLLHNRQQEGGSGAAEYRRAASPNEIKPWRISRRIAAARSSSRGSA